MRRWLVLAVLFLGCGATRGPVDQVDPFLGTGGHGHTYPGATVPFGMVQLSPDTRLTGWDGCSGYHHTDDIVYGFSHTHLSGTGISDYGDVLLMPVAGDPTTRNGAVDGPEHGYASRFHKSSETASPGYYAVRLDEGPIDVELTASARTGVHRYRFPENMPAHVIVDLAHRDRVTDSLLRRVGPREIEGWRHSTGWARDQRLWFVARFSRPMAGLRLERRAGGARVDGPEGELLDLPAGATEAAGDDVRAVLSFGLLDEPLTVHVGLSPVDIAGARANLAAESRDRPFETVHAAARQAWSAALRRVVVEGGSEAHRTSFYTALYHSLLAPNLASDVDGRYRGMDREVHQAVGRSHYTVFSLWDTFRATHPLFTILERARTREFIETFLAMYRQGGRLPVWELAGNETDTMIGYHAVPVIVDAWVKGIDGFDQEAALDAMLHSATLDHHGLDAYRRQGFIGAEDDAESVSKTLEYAFDDFCIARMARGLGHTETAAEFDARSQAWRHLLDPETGFFRARHNQRWIEPFDPRRVDLHYTEANAWQYSLFVPHDLTGLMEALGGDEALVTRLDHLFGADSRTTGRDQADITGLIGQYAHGNEPSHHMAWLYHYAGRPDRSAERVRQILTDLYAAAPDGLPGNEDCGQMSSWYVFSALGLYPVTPCTDTYLIGVPLFDAVTLELENGRTFRIVASGSGPYVHAARWNGEPLERSYLRHGEILAGGRLELDRGEQPGARWGRVGRPPSAVEAPAVLAAPFVRSASDRFRDTLRVELMGPEGAEIVYGIDAEPRHVYQGPITLDRSATLLCFARDGERRSPTVASYLHRLPNDWRVTTRHRPNPQYTAGGPESLVDGLRGAANWRMGGWQGYQDTDFEAVVDLGATHTLQRVGASFLQDQRSWIWMPRQLVVSVSGDGESFREVARIGHDVPADREGVIVRDLVQSIPPTPARFVRVLATSYGAIPSWHPGHGDRAFVFVDELLLE